MLTGDQAFSFRLWKLSRDQLFHWEEYSGMAREEAALAMDVWLPAHLPPTEISGWIGEEFCPWRAKPQEEASCPPAQSCTVHLVPSACTSDKLDVIYAWDKVKSLCGAGCVSITSAEQLSSPLSLTEKWLSVFWVCAFRRMRNPWARRPNTG